MQRWEEIVLHNKDGNGQRATGKRAAFYVAWCLVPLAFTNFAHADVTVNFSDVHQTIDGFGAADVWLNALSDSQADLFFSPTAGIGLSILRMGIEVDGSSLSSYSDATKAAARGAKIWAAPWSAAAAYKDNNNVNNGGHLCAAAGQGSCNASHYNDWANTLTNYAASFQQNTGVPLYGLSIQNEPDYTASYESMNYTNQEMENFIKVLGPKLAALNPRPKILMPEVSSWGNAWGFSSAILGDSAAAPYLDIIAAHQYAGVSGPPQTYTQHIWETEMSSFEGFDPSISNGIGVAKWIYDALTIGNVNAWHYWWLMSDNTDDEGLIGNGKGDTTITKRLYTMGNYSKFVRPGFVMVGVGGSSPVNVWVTAFKNPSTGDFVIVAINNNGDTPVNFDLNGLTASSVTPWVTSTSLNLAAQSSVPVTNGVLSYTLPTYSVTSFVGSSGTTQPPSSCDMNNDGTTNISDIQICVNQAIGFASCTTCDINKDGICNIIDVQRDVNSALGQACVSP